MKKYVTINLNSSVVYPMMNVNTVQNLNTKFIPYGQDNLFPLFVIDLLNKSSIHNAIQLGKIELSIGDGLTWDVTEENASDVAIIEKLFNVANSDLENLDQVFCKLMFDEVVFGAHALQVIWSRDKKTISEVYHQPFHTIRKAAPDQNGNINDYLISTNWENWRKKQYAPQPISGFSMTKGGTQLLYNEEYFPNNLYPQPTYIASTHYILIDHEIAKTHLNSIKNGLATNFLLNISSGIPSEEEQDDFADEVKRNIIGSSGQKVLVTFSEGKDNAPVFQPIEIQNEHEKYVTLNEAVIQNLLTANRLTSPELLGVKTPGQLGNSDIEKAFDIYYNQVITKLQNRVLQTLNNILKINGVKNTKLSVIKPTIITNNFANTIADRIMTINELRSQLGLETLENKDKLIGE